MHKVKFSCTKPHGDREHYLTEDDVRVLLDRLPYETWERLKAVHFNDQSWGARRAGYVTESHREIAICAMPPRVSMTGYLTRKSRQSPGQFGAVRGKQWPRVAVRRFLLYDVFLHELGHMQVIDPKEKSVRRRFAGERKAQEFADEWRKTLWSQPFDHPDPVHNPPTKQELAEAEGE
ncbi:MAG: conjugal transfer protein TraF [Planctomycetes bacterium]|nr:conjugal transfer protein TraF [Planctomycetota bacterium]